MHSPRNKNQIKINRKTQTSLILTLIKAISNSKSSQHCHQDLILISMHQTSQHQRNLKHLILINLVAAVILSNSSNNRILALVIY